MHSSEFSFIFIFRVHSFKCKQRGTYDTIFDEVDTLFRKEERPLKEILNPGVLAKLLDQVCSSKLVVEW